MKHSDALRYDLIVIGGGAAGFFGAINAAQNQPGLAVLILEKIIKAIIKSESVRRWKM